MGEGDVYKFNEILKKKVQKGAEACNILIGQAAFLKAEQKIVAFVRLHEPIKGETKLHQRRNKYRGGTSDATFRQHSFYIFINIFNIFFSILLISLWFFELF